MTAPLVPVPSSVSRRFAPRTELALFLTPMLAAFLLAQVSRALWPTLLVEAPWTLLVASVSFTRWLLVQPLVHPAVFFSLAIARPLVMAPVYYFFGRRYGDVGLRWAERKLGSSSSLVGKVERFFGRFAHALVLWSPTMVNATMAGAVRMRARVFFTLAIVGIVVRASVVYFLGDLLSAPLHDISDFVSRYQWYVTPITITVTALLLARRMRRHATPIESIDEFDADLEQAATELGSEATLS